MSSQTQFPVGGPRQPVYDLMRQLGFSESNWSDKVWRSADGLEVTIYGAGSMARVLHGNDRGECKLDDLGSHIRSIRNRTV